ncbi:MAG: hypothetical protein JOZ32_19950 [Bryobacterales bacterium]|nr:hypothetical protein [Bryobacterales bacterium]
MPKFRGDKGAFGAPGIEPDWTQGNKDGVGTANSEGSRVWFTLSRGILNEIYHPTVDRPQTRDLQFLFADGQSVFLDEKRDLPYEMKRMEPSQGYSFTKRDPQGRFSLVKEVIADPIRSCVLIHTALQGHEKFLETLKVYVLCAPHLEVAGEGNNAYVVEVCGRDLLVAEKKGLWLALGASCGFSRLSCGYVGSSDGYTDLKTNARMDYEFDHAKNGNVALTGELNLPQDRTFTLGLAFGNELGSAVSVLFQSLGVEYKDQRRVFIDQWKKAASTRQDLAATSGDKGALFSSSYNLLLTHEDNIYQGAFVASLSIPWGNARNDKQGEGGYHLVWTRDLVESAMALLAGGNTELPLRALIYLSARQNEDGSFPQNFWVNGKAYWDNTQLDEMAFPVMLARRLKHLGKLNNFDPLIIIKRAICFLLQQGPVTAEERWEEHGGYSPSTFAALISAFICAAAFEREAHEEDTAEFLESYADYLRSHLEDWMVTTEGSLVPGIKRYYVRLNPAKPGEVPAPGSVNTADLPLTSRAPGAPQSYPARNIVDGGFLQLVRYGIVAPNDPVVVDTLRVVDASIKSETPYGPSWRRYNHDGYGQRPDGSPYVDWGQGRPWPLLTGERGHYELAAGHDPRPFLTTMEKFGSFNGLLDEQVWDEADKPDKGMYFGQATGSAAPLLWAHAEYIRLLRSTSDGKVFDLIDEVAARYLKGANRPSPVEFWLWKHPTAYMTKGRTLRVCMGSPFQLRWTADGWATQHDSHSHPTAIGAQYVDIATSPNQECQIEFTFFWPQVEKWEGKNFQVNAQ